MRRRKKERDETRVPHANRFSLSGEEDDVQFRHASPAPLFLVLALCRCFLSRFLLCFSLDLLRVFCAVFLNAEMVFSLSRLCVFVCSCDRVPSHGGKIAQTHTHYKRL
jgi:hypothetical protein